VSTCRTRASRSSCSERSHTAKKAKNGGGTRTGWPTAERRVRAEDIQAALRSDQLAVLGSAYGHITSSAVRMITQFNAEFAELEGALAEHFEQHPDAKLIRSLPGLVTILGARVLA
jgi:hypothetical protein